MDTRVLTVGLMADPGLPSEVAGAVAGTLSDDLAGDAVGGAGTRWEVEVSQETLPLTPDGEVPLLEHAEALRDRHGWDYVVYLTDLPRFHDGDPMLCEASAQAGAAMISLPVLGAFRLRARTRRLLPVLLRAVRDGAEGHLSAPSARRGVVPGAARRVASQDGTDLVYLVLPGVLTRWRLLAGMVRSNRPGRMLPTLSSCVAAAAATGAFGIFYASIWNMSDALPPVRLAAISTVVVIALSAWLIYHNGLWNRRRSSDDRRRARLDNASTAVTVGLSVALMYVVLWAGLFAVGLAVIDSGYLRSQLGHPVGLLDYAHLSWLASSLGTLAGALGSNFDSDEAIREATYSRRVHQRRLLADSYED